VRHERQVELLRRVERSGPQRQGLHAPASARGWAAAYVDGDRFDDELRLLFRGGVVFAAMSCELASPGSYWSGSCGGVPIVVVRQGDGSLRAMVNACRHRAAPLFEPGPGGGLRALQCPYHSWTYDLDGALRSRPGAAGAFDDVEASCDLHPRAVAERYGMIFVRPDSTAPIDVDVVLSGAEDDLCSFGLGDHVHIESRALDLAFNWKLLLDTFTEQYHIRTLHADTLAPTFDSKCVIFEPFGHNLVSIGLRADVTRQLERPTEEWELLPYATIQYFVLPNALVVHQIDHVELWRIEPLAVDRTRAVVSMFAPTEPHSDRARSYFVKNLDLLLRVTTTEDFPMMERIQANLASGAIDELVYGRIEPPLIHLHRSIEAMLDAARGAADGSAST
jgi:phenylpropionate dioxygenase-like ring-hydroxylating dioxygenase large terminal subunit